MFQLMFELNFLLRGEFDNHKNEQEFEHPKFLLHFKVHKNSFI
jgi:hypothetical protein